MLVICIRRCARSLKRFFVLACSFLIVTSIYFMTFYVRSTIKMVVPGTGLGGLLFQESGHQGHSRSAVHNEDLLAQIGQACVHPKLDVWHPLLKDFFKGIEPLQCFKNEENWVYTNNGSIYISKSAQEKHGKILCQCLPLKRIDDFAVHYESPIKPLLNGTELTSDFFDVRCVGQDGAIYTNVHSGIRRDPELQKKSERDQVPEITENPLGLNILMFGFDSVSSMTWQRNLPRSHKYFVDTLGGIVLEGYNIVGDGTPQALLPILTGKTEEELPEARRGYPDAATVDGHPWIWKELKNLGYVTQWGEDGASAGTFTYRMLGFKDQPVDHYMRPFYLKAEARYARGQPYCLGSVPRHLNMLNWVKQFFQSYPHKPKFSFLFHSEYSHDMYNELKWADDDLKDFLEFLHTQGHLENTLLILMADHGARFQTVRHTVQGKYEERMPFFSFRFPPKFQKQHPKVMDNFRINAQRLTTPFDIHATFHDVINFTGSGIGDVSHRGISLFKEIPRERTCEHAGVEPHWCTCLNWVDVSVTDKVVQRAVNHLVKTINDVTEKYRGDCVELSLFNISSAVKFSPNDRVLKFKQTIDQDGRMADFSDDTTASEILYQVTITTKPSLGKYEATVKYFPAENKFVANAGEISRINRYGNQPHCVMEKLPHLRPYCYCKHQLHEPSTH